MSCPNCGTDDPGDTGYCKSCGRAVALKPATTTLQVIFALVAGCVFGIIAMGSLAILAIAVSGALRIQKSPVVFVVANFVPVAAFILLVGTKRGRSLGVWMTTFIVTTLVVCLGALSICTMVLTQTSYR